MNNPKILHCCKDVVFFGPDGAGKTTLAQDLVGYFRANGRRSRICWMRGRHSLAFMLAQIFTRLGYYRTIKSPDGSVSFDVFDPSLLPKIRRLWQFLEFISILPWIITRFYLPKALGYVVVSERYVVDTVVYLGYWLGEDTLLSFLSRVLLSFVPRDSFLIHMDAETSVLLQRRFDDVITEDYIVFQRKAYKTLARSLNALTIDTTSSGAEENFQRILQYIGSPSCGRR